MEKYKEEFHVQEKPRALASWRKHAWQQIERWLDDEDFYNYISTEVMSKDENAPGPFTRFLYWFGLSCQTGWGVMIDFNEHTQRIFLCDHYYKWMHKLRDEIYAAREQTELKNESPTSN